MDSAESLLKLLDSDLSGFEDLGLGSIGTWMNPVDVSQLEPTFTDISQSYQTSDPVSIARDLQIPLEPRHWETSHVLRWVEWTLRRQCATDDVELWRISEQLRLQAINGDHLLKWTAYEHDKIFNYSSEHLRHQLALWLQGIQTTTDDFYLGQAQLGLGYEYNSFNYIDPFMFSSLDAPHSVNKLDEDFILSLDSETNNQECSPSYDQQYPPYTWKPDEDAQSYSSQGDSLNSSSSSDSGLSSDDDDEYVTNQRKVGRPLKSKPVMTKRRHPILYKFILEHLNDPSISHGYVEWVNKSEGLFRFNSRRKDKFAEMWSKAKGKNKAMTYQNMARALRNYTRPAKRIMERVPKKLHYKFVPAYIV